jgi:hypothetical protein
MGIFLNRDDQYVLEHYFRLPDEGEKFTTNVREMSCREDHKALKAIMDQGYKKAERVICRSLMAPRREEFILQNEGSQN